MAFQRDRLELFASADGFNLWAYTDSGDAVPAILAPGYFSPAASVLGIGDFILLSPHRAETPVAVVVRAVEPAVLVELTHREAGQAAA